MRFFNNFLIQEILSFKILHFINQSMTLHHFIKLKKAIGTIHFQNCTVSLIDSTYVE